MGPFDMMVGLPTTYYRLPNWLWKNHVCPKSCQKENVRRNKTADWVSKIKLPEKTEEDIRKCFEGTKVDFHYPEDLSDFNLLIKNFQREDIVNGDYYYYYYYYCCYYYYYYYY